MTRSPALPAILAHIARRDEWAGRSFKEEKTMAKDTGARGVSVKYLKAQLIDGIAKSLREFGYPDVTPAMIDECWTAYERGDQPPQGVIGLFAERSLDEIAEARPDLLTKGTAA